MLLKVEKMSCGHCVRAVTEAVHTVDPEAKVEVDLPTQTVRVQGRATPEATAAAIREEGYTVQVQEA